MTFSPLRLLVRLAFASGWGVLGLVAAEFEGSVRSTDPLIVQFEGERAKFYAAASYEKAIDASLQGYARAVEIGAREHQMLFLRHLTYDHWLLGNSESAVDHGLRLLQLADETGSIDNRSRANRYLSQIYYTLNDNVRSEKYARDALADADRAEHPNLRAFARERIGLCAQRNGDFATARRELTAALDHWRAIGDKNNIFVVRRELGDLAVAEGDLDGALAIYEEVVELSSAGGNPLSVARSLLRTVSVLRQKSRLAEAMARIERARPLVARVGGNSLRREFYLELALTEEARGEFGAALAAQRMSAEAGEAMAGAQARMHATEAESRRDLELKQQAIDRLKLEKATQAAELRASVAELRRTREMRTALGLGAVTIAIALGLIIASQRARLRAERSALDETRRARTIAEDADVLKTRLLAIASHDLKGPLRSLLRSADVIEKKAGDVPAVTQAARLMRGNAQRMFELVRDLLDLAAIESGNLELQRAPLDLGKLAAEIVARHQPRAEEKSQTLRCDVAEDTPLPFLGDAARLAQAIENLVDNAVKYTPVGGNIRVTAARRGSQLCVAVADDGPGLGPEDLSRMFQPFKRLSATPTGGESSTGLGLHITRDLVARHDGSVEVDTTPGRGTTFTLVFPAPAALPAS